MRADEAAKVVMNTGVASTWQGLRGLWSTVNDVRDRLIEHGQLLGVEMPKAESKRRRAA